MTREQAIDELIDVKYGYKEYLSNEAVDMAIEALEQEPKTGHWIDCECDKCGYVVQPWNTTSFCPNCGADMREVEK